MTNRTILNQQSPASFTGIPTINPTLSNEELVRAILPSLVATVAADPTLYSPSSSRQRHADTPHIAAGFDVQSIEQAITALTPDQPSDTFIQIFGQALLTLLGASSGGWISKGDQFDRRLARENSVQEINLEEWNIQFPFKPISQRSNCQNLPQHQRQPAYPTTAISHCLHQQRTLIVSDATNDALTHSDPFTQSNQVRSLLCIPVLINNSIHAVIYMESEAPNMFTSERLYVAHLLAKQATLSLENSRLQLEMQSMREAHEREMEKNRCQLEEARDAAIAAQRLTTNKSEYLAQMSHELRTPMSGVIGGTSLILDSMSDLTADQREIVHIIRSSGEVMLTLINDILDLSKIEAGRVELEQAQFSFRQCVEQAFDVLAEKASVKRLSFMHYVPITVPDCVIGDQTRLRQILINLLGNAVKFTQQGHVLLRATAKEVSPETPTTNQLTNQPASSSRSMSISGPAVSFSPMPRTRSIRPANERWFEFHVSVIDSGVGIPPAAQEGLFQTFSQVHSLSDSNKYGGSGLGLSISHQLCKLMNGRMWCESTGLPGEGSTFHFTFRVPISPEAPPPYLQGEHPDLKGKHLLIVKGNPVSAELIGDTCRAWGIEPHCARSLSEAESLMRSRAFNFALIDYGFSPPDMTINHPLLTIAELQQSSSLSRASSSDSSTGSVGEDSEMSSEAGSTASQSLGDVNGLHVAQLIRRHYLTHSQTPPPIIMLAGLAQRQKSLRAVVDGFLSKPLKPSKFFQTLLNVSRDSNHTVDSRDSSPSNSPALENGRLPIKKLSSKRKHGTLMLGQSHSSSSRSTSPTALNGSSRSSAQFDECPNYIAHMFPLRILVCEDNVINQKIIRKMLERAGYGDDCVTFTDNGKSAYEECSAAAATSTCEAGMPADPTLPTSCYHCVLMDVFLPVMDGLEATRRIRNDPAIPPHCQPFVIALTASSMHGDKEKCMKAGMDLFLSKPITIPRLVAALKTAHQSITSKHEQTDPDFESPGSMRPTKLANRTGSDTANQINSIGFSSPSLAPTQPRDIT